MYTLQASKDRLTPRGDHRRAGQTHWAPPGLSHLDRTMCALWQRSADCKLRWKRKYLGQPYHECLKLMFFAQFRKKEPLVRAARVAQAHDKTGEE